MIGAEPAATPVTIPDVAPMVATAVLPLVHVPPVESSVSVTVPPLQTGKTPPMAAGIGLIVTAATDDVPDNAEEGHVVTN